MICLFLLYERSLQTNYVDGSGPQRKRSFPIEIDTKLYSAIIYSLYLPTNMHDALRDSSIVMIYDVINFQESN